MGCSEDQISFPLFHGTSSFHLNAFKIGRSPQPWSHKETALDLLRQTWRALIQHGQEPDWWVQRVLDQGSGHSNWRHGVLYATASQLSAVRYADGGGAYGGELLTLCHDAIGLLRESDEELATKLLTGALSLAQFLNGGGEPIVVEIRGLAPTDLLPEREKDDVADMLSELSKGDENRELIGQQMNFAIKPDCGLISRVCRVRIASPGDPLTSFQLEQIQ